MYHDFSDFVHLFFFDHFLVVNFSSYIMHGDICTLRPIGSQTN